ncbi:Universal stress protein E [Novipirellula aureliae]|uniref:Universal stress protein E n=1 Tax=Novipirellula aureliae TaxID=2527966 RepID=A0A5C6DVW4_9BACT|nr:universal stress protein [Novipirellula aureliae]TWU40067.1 Universal stress protein E [Novipirellula aureliae]
MDALAETLRNSGLDVDTKVIVGKSSVEIVCEVLRDKHDLVMRVAKRASSRRKGFFGTTSKRLLRECPCAVHFVASEQPTSSHVLACIDTSTGEAEDAELNERILTLATTIASRDKASVSIAHAWMVDGEHIHEGRIPVSEFNQMRCERKEYVTRMLNEFLEPGGFSSEDGNVFMLKGYPANVIPKFIQTQKVDFVVMGTVGRSGAAGRLIGNTAEEVLESIECSVMAVKPKTYISPMKLGEYIAASKQL